VKDFSPNEYGLIAKKASTVKGEKTCQPFERKQMGMALIELAIKRTANHPRVLQRHSNRVKVQIGQLRIGVMKDENVAARVFRSEIHLCPPIRRLRAEINTAGAADDFRSR